MDPEQQALDPDRVAELMSSGEAQVIDVRTDEEWDAGRVPGAQHIPFDELPARAEGLDRSRPIVLYCHTGGRSAAASQAFVASGWEAHSMAGGLSGWAERGLPLEPDGGEVVHQSGLPA